MKKFLAAATVATLLAAPPASAQTVYGVATAPGGDGTGVITGADGSWKGSFVIYSTVDSIATPNAAVAVPGASSAILPGGAAGSFTAEIVAAHAFNAQAAIPSVNATTPVPEPATWAMMLIGFGAVGSMLRTRRTVALRFA